jgi:hypothetical protein
MTDARTPTSHNNTYHSVTFIAASDVTYENLNSNSDVGQAASTVAAGDDNRFPTANEKAALAGTGTPGAGDLYVNDSDSRMTDARTPTSHGNAQHTSTFIAAAGVTYENLDANGDIGQVASTVAAGDDSRFATANQKAALAGTGTPGAGDLYVNDSDSRMTDARTPTSHGNAQHSSTFIVATDVTYENLNSNSDIGQAASTVAAGDDNRFPTANQKAALAGTGTPGAGDLYVNDSDSRMTDARTPTSHGNGQHSSTFITTSGVTYEALSGNSDIGQAASTVAAGDDSRFPTSDEKSGIAGLTGSNVALGSTDRDKVPTKYLWKTAGTLGATYGPAVADDPLSIVSSGRFVMPAAGSVVKVNVQVDSGGTAGNVTVEPAINGTTPSTENGLDIVAAYNSGGGYAEIAVGTTNLTFTAGQTLVPIVSTDGSWDNTNALRIEYFVVFNS